MTAMVRQVDLPPSARELSTLPRIDYSDAFLFDVGSTRDVSAEDLMREVLEGAPLAVRTQLLSGWSAIGLKVRNRVGTIRARLGDPQSGARSCASRCRLAHRNARRVASQEGRRRTAFRDIRGAAESARPGGMDRHRTRACSGRARHLGPGESAAPRLNQGVGRGRQRRRRLGRHGRRGVGRSWRRRVRRHPRRWRRVRRSWAAV